MQINRKRTAVEKNRKKVAWSKRTNSSLRPSCIFFFMCKFGDVEIDRKLVLWLEDWIKKLQSDNFEWMISSFWFNFYFSALYEEHTCNRPYLQNCEIHVVWLSRDTKHNSAIPSNVLSSLLMSLSLNRTLFWEISIVRLIQKSLWSKMN